MKKLLLPLLLIGFAVSLFAQDKKFNLNPWGGLNGYQVSVGFINHFEAEASYILTSRPQPDPRCCDFSILYGFQSISIGVNYAIFNNKSLFGPKVFCQMSYFFLATQVGLDYMTDFGGNGQFRFTPKVGLTALGYLSILYGRNYNLMGPAYEGKLPQHGSLSVQLQIPVSK